MEKETPATSSHVLGWHTSSPNHDNSFHYWVVIRMLNYLDAGSYSDIAYAIAYVTHQCARFSVNIK